MARTYKEGITMKSPTIIMCGLAVVLSVCMASVGGDREVGEEA